MNQSISTTDMALILANQASTGGLTGKELCAKTHLVYMFHGPPGIGKTQIIQTIGEATNREVIVLSLSQVGPSAIKGHPIPDMDTRSNIWMRPVILERRQPERTNGRIIFLDEVTLAPPEVQGSVLELVADRAVGCFKLNDEDIIVLAGNDREDTPMARPLTGPAANRMVHFWIHSDFAGWSSWATLNDAVNPNIVAFLAEHTAYFHERKAVHTDTMATPRSWTNGSRAMAQIEGMSIGDEDTKNRLMRLALEGAVGSGAATQYFANEQLYKKMPSLEKVLSGEANPKSLDRSLLGAFAWKMSASLFHRADKILRDSLGSISPQDVSGQYQKSEEFIKQFESDYTILAEWMLQTGAQGAAEKAYGVIQGLNNMLRIGQTTSIPEVSARISAMQRAILKILTDLTANRNKKLASVASFVSSVKTGSQQDKF